MRQHVNPFSRNFDKVEPIPSLNDIFDDPDLPLHLDVGSAAGDFLLALAEQNGQMNYMGIEIREKLVKNARLKTLTREINNLYFVFGNVNNILRDPKYKSLVNSICSISFNFPDPWFKKRHHKRRVIQPELINNLSNSMQKGSFISIKTDVKQLFDYMENIIKSNLCFKKLNTIDYNSKINFNPTQIKTNREKYVISNQLKIFESIYTKI